MREERRSVEQKKKKDKKKNHSFTLWFPFSFVTWNFWGYSEQQRVQGGNFWLSRNITMMPFPVQWFMQEVHSPTWQPGDGSLAIIHILPASGESRRTFLKVTVVIIQWPWESFCFPFGDSLHASLLPLCQTQRCLNVLVTSLGHRMQSWEPQQVPRRCWISD